MARPRRPLARAAFVALAILTRSAAADPVDPRLVGPFTRDDYPQAVIDRPLTLPAGMVEGEVGGTFTSFRLVEPMFGLSGSDDWDVDLTVRVGVTDRLQIEAGTAFSLDHADRGTGFQGVFGPVVFRPSLTSWNRIVPVRLSLLALDTEAVDTAVTLTLPFVARASRTVTFGRGGSVTVQNSDRVLPLIALAAPTRWRLSDYFWVRAGEDLFVVTTGRGIARFAFDLGLGVQPHRIFAVTLDTRIASISFGGDGEEHSTTLADVGTIDLEGTLALLPMFDVVGSLGLFDVGRGFDDYTTRLAVRVRL